MIEEAFQISKRIIDTSISFPFFRQDQVIPDPEKFHPPNSSSPVRCEFVKKQVTITDLRNRNPSRANYRSYPWPVSKFLAGQLGQQRTDASTLGQTGSARFEYNRERRSQDTTSYSPESMFSTRRSSFHDYRPPSQSMRPSMRASRISRTA